MITGINELKNVNKCKCKFGGRDCNSNQNWNNDKCQCECKNPKILCMCQKYFIWILFGFYFIWNPATCSCENGKYLASIMDNSMIMWDEIIDAEAKSYDEETKTIPTSFNKKIETVKQEISVFFSPFY